MWLTIITVVPNIITLIHWLTDWFKIFHSILRSVDRSWIRELLRVLRMNILRMPCEKIEPTMATDWFFTFVLWCTMHESFFSSACWQLHVSVSPITHIPTDRMRFVSLLIVAGFISSHEDQCQSFHVLHLASHFFRALNQISVTHS